MQNVVSVLNAAGSKPGNAMMLKTYVTDISGFKSSEKAIAEGWRSTPGEHFPAKTPVQVAGYFDPDAKVEIETEAVSGGN